MDASPVPTTKRGIAWRAAGVACLAASLVACASTSPRAGRVDETTDASAKAGFSLRLIGRQRLEHGLQFGGTMVGGLSGIDYDPAHDDYYLISDDRSAFAPTRFYTARLSIDERRFDEVALQTVVTLQRPDGSPFPAGAADAEAVRYDPRTGDLWWTSEGDRRSAARRVDPFVRRASVDGRYVGDVPLDPMFRIVDNPRGPRDNLVFEGASLSIDGGSLWVSMEGPLLQDGPMPTMSDGAWARISRHDRDAAHGFGPLAAQFAYRVDPIPSIGAWTMWHALNGVAEILAIDTTRMLVLERALVLGAGWRIRLFEADWRTATDVKAVDALVGVPGDALPFVPMTKRLVLDFDTLGIAIDNLEGLCFGPTLANGHRTLVLVSDDNFNPGQVTQFLAFEIIPH